MTNREFLTAIANMENISKELKTEALARIAKIDATNEARKNKVSKKAEENAPLVDAAVAALGTETKVAADIAAELEVTVQKANHLLKTAVAQGRATVEDVKLPKKGTVKGYTAVIAD